MGSLCFFFCRRENRRGSGDELWVHPGQHRDQNEERQRLAMGELEIPEESIPGPPVRQDFDRPQYRKLVRRLKRDDVLYIRALTGWAGTIGRSWSSGGC